MPATMSLIVNLFFFGFTLWLGAYLLARNSYKMTVRLTGLGILFYAIVLALEILRGQQSNAILLIPALCWIGAVLYLIPEEEARRGPAIRGWVLAIIPVFILTLLNPWFSLIAVIGLLACVLYLTRSQIALFQRVESAR
jgi:hypothetical protein